MEKFSKKRQMKYFEMPTALSEADAVILANGDFPKHEVPLSILRNSNYLVCCDGAINKLKHTNIEPQAIVGDCDSLGVESKERYAKILFRNPDQETNDLTKAVNYCLEKGMSNLIILGATGQREDHTLGNISLLLEYMNEATVQMITDFGIFTPVDSDSRFESFAGQQVSIFTVAEGEITTHNLKYPVHKRTFTNWWQGTLNEAESDEFSIETNAKLVLFRIFK